jgi:hypothetical protein
MGVTRRIIFPALRILIWAVIAAALVKLAFAGSSVIEAEDPLQPGAVITEPHVEATTATITNTVTVAGSVISDPATPVRATMAGMVSAVLSADGPVAAGAPLIEIRLETPVEPTVTTNPETGEQTVVEHRPKITKQTVTAAIAGTLRLTVLKDQLVSVGDAIGSISPGTLSVTGTLTPDQQYRLISAPTEAEVALKGGPAPFVCTNLRIGAAAGSPDPPIEDAGQQASGTVTCSIPAEVIAFPGLGADISITNGTAEDAVVVPVTAVQGSVQNGNVWIVLPDGGNEEQAVTLGLTDGEMVQIVEGLAAGDVILEFVPVGDGPVTDPYGCDPELGC